MTCASGSDSARLAPYRSARQPAATTAAPDDAAPSSWSMDSSLAAWMNPQVLTRTTSAPSVSPGPVTVQPAPSSRAASSSESTSLRAQPREIRLTVRPARPAVGSRDGTPADYGKPASAAPADAPTHHSPARGGSGRAGRPPLTGPEAERDRLVGAGRRPGGRAVHDQRDPARVAELHADRVVHHPVPVRSRRDDAAEDRPAVAGGQVDPAVLRGDQPDRHDVGGGPGRGRAGRGRRHGGVRLAAGPHRLRGP